MFILLRHIERTTAHKSHDLFFLVIRPRPASVSRVPPCNYPISRCSRISANYLTDDTACPVHPWTLIGCRISLSVNLCVLWVTVYLVEKDCARRRIINRRLTRGTAACAWYQLVIWDELNVFIYQIVRKRTSDLYSR